MKNKDFEALARKLVPDLPGFSFKSRLMFRAPITHTLRGICFECSSDANAFYVWVFFLPLFIPRKFMSFEFGERLGRGDWKADDPGLVPALSKTLQREALPFLSRVESPQDMAKAAAALGWPDDPYTQEAVAYSWARAGNVARAQTGLRHLRALLVEDVAWQREMGERAGKLEALLLASPADAQRQLEAWEAESIAHLKLEKFRQ